MVHWGGTVVAELSGRGERTVTGKVLLLAGAGGKHQCDVWGFWWGREAKRTAKEIGKGRKVGIRKKQKGRWVERRKGTPTSRGGEKRKNTNSTRLGILVFKKKKCSDRG